MSNIHYMCGSGNCVVDTQKSGNGNENFEKVQRYPGAPRTILPGGGGYYTGTKLPGGGGRNVPVYYCLRGTKLPPHKSNSK